MHTIYTSVVVVTNFTKNGTNGAKRARGASCPCYGARRAIYFVLEEVTYFYVLYFLTNNNNNNNSL